MAIISGKINNLIVYHLEIAMKNHVLLSEQNMFTWTLILQGQKLLLDTSGYTKQFQCEHTLDVSTPT